MNKNGNNVLIKDKPFGRKSAYIILAVIIVIQVITVTYIFAFKKEGFHSDEMWTYGFSNSFYKPFLYNDAETGESTCERWADGSELRDYIVVNDGEQFRFDSVWYNQRNDMHPPLYCALVHFICSFFPNSFSRYYAYVLNFIAMVVGQIYLYRLASRLFKSDFYGIAACVIWGFSCGFINVNIFLRAYSLMVMFSIMLMFYHYRLYANEGKDSASILAIAAIIFSGAMMHHYFLVLSFAICAMFCLYLLVKRQWKRLFIYAGSALASVGISFLCFPQTLAHLQNEGPGNGERLSYRMPVMNGIKYCFSLLFSELSGIRVSSYVYPGYAYVIAVIVILLAVSVPLCFLFRKEAWFISFKEKAGEKLRGIVNKMNYIFVMMAVTIFFVIEIVAITVNLNSMMSTSDRYLFFVMPYMVMLAIMAVKYIFEHIKPIAKLSKPVICIMGCTAIFFSNLLSEKIYLFQFDTRGEGGIETTASDESSYVAVLSSYWFITVFPYKLMNCESFYVTTDRTYRDYMDNIAAKPVDDKTYVLIDNLNLNSEDEFKTKYDENGNEIDTGITFNVTGESYGDSINEEDIIEDFETYIYPGYKLQFYGSESIFERMIHIFKVVPEDEYVDVPIIDASLEKKALIEERRKLRVSLGEE